MKNVASVSNQLIDRAGICSFRWVVGERQLVLSDCLLQLCGLSAMAGGTVTLRRVLRMIDHRDRHELVRSLAELHGERQFGKWSARLRLYDGTTCRFDLHTAIESTRCEQTTLQGIIVASLPGSVHERQVNQLAVSVATSLPSVRPMRRPSRQINGNPVALPATGRPHVLVVDGNPDIADALSKLLTRQHWSVDTAYFGRHALRMAQERKPDIVFLEVALQDISGLDVARTLRQRQSDGALKLVAITGWGGDAGREVTRRAGFDYHLTKPAGSADIFRAMRLISR